mgnify:CR=1 FL=1
MLKSKTLVLAGSLLCVSASWAGNFSNMDLKGDYAYAGAGFSTAGNVVSSIGIFSPNGQGGATITGKVVQDGALIPIPDQECTYEVESDGTGTLDCLITDYAFVIDHNGQNAAFIPVADIKDENVSGNLTAVVLVKKQ